MRQHKQGQTVHKQRRCTEIQPVNKRQQRSSEYISKISRKLHEIIQISKNLHFRARGQKAYCDGQICIFKLRGQKAYQDGHTDIKI